MTAKEYNGWFNYETWCVNLQITNEQGSSVYWTEEKAREAWDAYTPEPHFTQAERAAITLADMLKSEFENANPLASGHDVFTDLLGAALSEVNWMEIAQHYIADLETVTV